MKIVFFFVINDVNIIDFWQENLIMFLWQIKGKIGIYCL